MARRLNGTKMQELAETIETCPDLSTDDVVCWRRIDLTQMIEARIGVVFQERSISDHLKALSFSYISGRPKHPDRDECVIEVFKKLSSDVQSSHQPSA